jgi:hypothetical protein
MDPDREEKKGAKEPGHQKGFPYVKASESGRLLSGFELAKLRHGPLIHSSLVSRLENSMRDLVKHEVPRVSPKVRRDPRVLLQLDVKDQSRLPWMTPRELIEHDNPQAAIVESDEGCLTGWVVACDLVCQRPFVNRRYESQGHVDQSVRSDELLQFVVHRSNV